MCECAHACVCVRVCMCIFIVCVREYVRQCAGAGFNQMEYTHE